MDIFFKEKSLQKICSTRASMNRYFGNDCSQKLAQRLLELQAADNLAVISHLPPPRCHELTGNRAGQFSIDVKHPYRLIFVPDHNPIPLKTDGGIDRSRVTAILIVGIIDTH